MVCQGPERPGPHHHPAGYGDGGILTKNFVGHPARPGPITGTIQSKDLVQYDFTPQQYQALIELTATLCKALPKIKCDYPKDAAGNLIRQKLPDAELKAYEGVLGHFHVQTDKVIPARPSNGTTSWATPANSSVADSTARRTKTPKVTASPCPRAFNLQPLWPTR